MPELPEVETTRRAILPVFTGQRIASITPLREDIWATDRRPPQSPLRGGEIVRHGKTLIFSLLPDEPDRSFRPIFLLSRFGMSGRWDRRPRNSRPAPHTHLEIFFPEAGVILAWSDPRRFGRLEISPSLRESRLLAGTGPDALSLDGPSLFKIFRSLSTPLRKALTHPALLSGIGNIYMAEILFDAGLSPFRPAGSLSLAEASRLAQSLHRILNSAIACGGSTIHSYRQEDGSPGDYQKFHAVYGREGAPCQRCGLPLQRTTVEARSLYYCALCQPASFCPTAPSSR
ncbi:MAG: Fpg/Nei family DNA glycosylase [Leptospirillia bacterium]